MSGGVGRGFTRGKFHLPKVEHKDLIWAPPENY